MTEIQLKPLPQFPTATSATVTWPRLGRVRLIVIGLLALLMLVFLLSLAVGSVTIPLDEILTVLLGGEASKASWTQIVINFRLPKAITAVLVGAALGISGLMMQTFFRNPLAGPFVLGISSGAGLGVALVVLSVGTAGGVLLAGISLLSDLGLAAAAMLGAGLVMGLVLLVARAVRSSMTLLVLGVMIGFLTNALVSLLMFFSIPEQIQAYVNWTFGSFSAVTWSELRVLVPAVLLGLALAISQTKALNALLLGEAYARSLGLNVRRTRLWLVLATAILAGVVTAFAGPIGFIGIAVPHLCRSLFGTADHRALVPGTLLVGALVALLAAFIAEVPGSNLVLPLNAVTAVIGAPVVILVILRRRNLDRSFAG
jgi:iron complex transport system permease protein